MSDSIKIAFAPDNNCFALCVVAMTSIMINTSRNIEFIIIYSSLSDEAFSCLNSLERYSNCKLVYKQVDENIFDGFRNAGWLTVQAWFRVLIPDLFPELNKVLYLDCDIMVRKDISGLWEKNLLNFSTGVVEDVLYNNINVKRLSLKSNTYFNSGVMLFNCEKWRNLQFFQRIKQCVQNTNLIRVQDVLNSIIDEDKFLFSPKYNYIETRISKIKLLYEFMFKKRVERSKSGYNGEFLNDYNNHKDIVLVHFAGFKPTKAASGHTFKDEWWDYAKKTPVYLKLLEEYKKDADNFTLLNQFFNTFKK